MEMLYKSNGVHKSLFVMLSVIVAVAVLALPATAMFSSSGIEIREEYNEGLKMSALTDEEMQMQEETELPKAEEVKQPENIEQITPSEIVEESQPEQEQKVAVFDKDGKSSVPYTDEYSYCATIIERRNDSERQTRYRILSGEIKRTYQLNGEYSKFTGSQILFFDARQTSRKSEFLVYADGKLIYTGRVMTGGETTEDFDIDVTGVNELTIQYRGSSSRDYYKYEFAGLTSCYFER